METALVIVALVSLAAVAAVFLVPREVAYAEETIVRASAAEVYDNIRFQARLMRWSAWPAETRSECAVEGPDGEVGARTVFLRPGGMERFGFQEVTALEANRHVELRLTSKGPPQSPVLAFDLESAEPGATRVVLRFSNTLPRPFNVFLRVAGIVRWTRAMHRKDLAGLKRFSEEANSPDAGRAPYEATLPT